MTDKEIINQWKHERELAECVCSYFVDQVELSLVNETIDLINRQKSEIERLKECPKCVYEYDGEISEYCIQGPCTNFTHIEKIKSEAYKEFAKAVKEEIKKLYDNNLYVFREHLEKHKDNPDFEFLSTITGKTDALRGLGYFIDNLLKEMVGVNK